MATDTSGGGGNTFLAFVLGAVLVVVAVIGFFVFTGGHFSLNNNPAPSINVNLQTPTMPKPAQ
jgi:hypothetical protein